MRTIWNALSFMAVANLVAILAIGAWLVAGGRVDRDRVQKVRSVFVETVEQERSRLEAEEKQRLAAEEAALAEAKAREGAPIPVADAMDMRVQRNADDEQRLERLRKEVRMLQEAIARDQRKIDADIAALEQRERAFQAVQDEIKRTEGDKQFKKAVGVLEGLEAADATKMLSELMRGGKMEQVVSYLNAMQDRKRSAILNELVTAGQPDVAADLLERLRMRGSEVPVSNAPETQASAGP